MTAGGRRLTMSEAIPGAIWRGEGAKMKPTASAPMATASSASASLVVPQILTNTPRRYRFVVHLPAMPPTPVGWAEALVAVESMASRISSLIRSISDPDAPALGVWTKGQLAAHITHVYEVDLDLLNEVPPPLDDLADLAELTQSKVRDEAVCDPPALADRVDRASDACLAVARGMTGAEPRLWVGGVKVTASVLACHIMNESMVHGLDLAGGSWKITRRDARLAFEGFICPMYRSLGRPSF